MESGARFLCAKTRGPACVRIATARRLRRSRGQERKMRVEAAKPAAIDFRKAFGTVEFIRMCRTLKDQYIDTASMSCTCKKPTTSVRK